MRRVLGGALPSNDPPVELIGVAAVVKKTCDIVVGAMLGEGGMSRVHRAQHRTRDFELAVKIAKPSFEPRIRREYDALKRFHDAGIDHDGFVALCPGMKLGFCSGPRDGQLCMELLEGKNCSSLGKCRDWKQALNILKRVAEALEHLHEAQWIHRDVKPGNVVLTIQGKAKLVDFGLARAIGGTRETSEHSEPGWGTPAYMAPEQIYQNPMFLTPAVDAFALGGLFFHLLVGTPPPRNAIEGDFDFPNVESGPVTDDSRHLLQACQVLVDGCTRPRPRSRLSARQVTDAVTRMQVDFKDVLHRALPALAAPARFSAEGKSQMTSGNSTRNAGGGPSSEQDASLPRGLRRLQEEHAYWIPERDLRRMGRLELSKIPELQAIPWIRCSWIQAAAGRPVVLLSDLYLRRIVMDGKVARESYFAAYTECELLGSSVTMFERPGKGARRHVGCRTSEVTDRGAIESLGLQPGGRARRFTFFVADVEQSGNPEVPVASIVLGHAEGEEVRYA